jgi:hypothetical protein
MIEHILKQNNTNIGFSFYFFKQSYNLTSGL